jgi:hypothetical protein
MVVSVIALLCTAKVQALGYYYNRKGESVYVPDAYTAEAVIDGISLGIGSFNNISDLYVDSTGRLFIADTGNNRIVIIGRNNAVIKIITELYDGSNIVKLSSPEGVYYRNGKIYICNTGAKEVLAADDNGRILMRYVRPESASLPENTEFKPSKVAVNAAGSVFVAASGIYQGLIQYNQNGEFINFFGATRVEITLAVFLENIWKSIFTKAQREGMYRIISNELSNLFIDNEDFVYTVTSSVNTKQVRRLNAAGENILKYPGYDDSRLFTSGYNRNNFGDQEFDYSKGQLIVSKICDVHVDSEGIISVLDSARGKVFQYNQELDPICIFGGTGDQKGYFRKAACIEKRGNEYLIADAEKNTITCMWPTAYIRKIRSALAKYRLGEYSGAVDEWQDILKQNPYFTIAYRSIGRSLLQEGKSRQALEYLREGDDRYYYSLAMQEYRRGFIRANWYWVFLMLFLFFFGVLARDRVKKWVKSFKFLRRGQNV